MDDKLNANKKVDPDEAGLNDVNITQFVLDSGIESIVATMLFNENDEFKKFFAETLKKELKNPNDTLMTIMEKL